MERRVDAIFQAEATLDDIMALLQSKSGDVVKSVQLSGAEVERLLMDCGGFLFPPFFEQKETQPHPINNFLFTPAPRACATCLDSHFREQC
jgi:hypothetical protein